MQNCDIRLGVGGPRIGEVHLDPTAIHGVGGWHDPRFVVPLRLVLQPKPTERMIALIRLSGSLHGAETYSTANQLGTPITLDLLENLPCRTVPSSSSEHRPELCFSLTQSLVARLEELRHNAPDNRMSLYLHLRGVCAWIRHTGNSHDPFDPAKSTLGEGGWEPNVGMFSEMLPFWSTHFDTLRIDIEPSVWVDKVLPGLGYDSVRLVEMDFSAIHDEGIIRAQFDKARRNYDEQHYEACVQDCRGIQNAWEKLLGTPRGQHMVQKLADHLHWPADDWHYKMVDSIWKGYADMVNAPHHPEHTPSNLSVTPDDARLCLLLTAVLTEYIERLRKG